jgi:kynurenine formamidase
MRQIAFRRVVDLSLLIAPDTQMFPAYPSPAFTPWTTRDVHGFLSESLFLISHTGTHVDAPYHFEPGGKKIDDLSLERFVIPGHVLDVRGLRPKTSIGPDHLRPARRRLHRKPRPGDAILLWTSWGRKVGTRPYLYENPGLSGAGAKLLVEWQAGLVGIDTANIDHPDDSKFPAHHTLLRAGILVVENVSNLAELGPGPFLLVALPLRLAGATGSPIRLVALV